MTTNARGARRGLSGSELRRLLVLRSRLREAIVGAPRSVQRHVLRALETARRSRLESHPQPWTPPAMTRGELIREIKWRLDVAALTEVEAAARVFEQARRRRVQALRRRTSDAPKV